MGIFDKLKKIANSVPQSVQKAVDEISDVANEVINQSKSSADSPSADVQPSYSQPSYAAACANNASLKTAEYFAEIILPEFSEYQIEQKVPATRFSSSAHPACVPVDFLFFLNGTPVLAVALVKSNTYRGMNVIGTKELCEANNVKYIKFFVEMANEPSYVINRIRENLA